MTNEEAINLLDNLIGMIEDNQNSDYNQALHMGINSLKSEQQWIPCSERVPEKENEGQRRGWYLTTNAYGVVSITAYEFDGDFGFIGWGSCLPADIDIIAWKPLPEPFKGGKQ